jgi:hypothetical protein
VLVVLTTFGRSGMTTSHSIALGDWEITPLAATSSRVWVASDRVKAVLWLLRIINDLTALIMEKFLDRCLHLAAYLILL